MANFKVGQRVKKVAHMAESDCARQLSDYPGNRAKAGFTVPLGAQGTILGEGYGATYEVMWDGVAPPPGWSYMVAFAYMIAPLTDSKADAFIESIKRLEREPKAVPLPEKERL